MNTYQDHLTASRRLAHWEALERMRQSATERRSLELAMCRPARRSDAWQAWRGEPYPPKQSKSLLVLAILCWLAVLGVAGFVFGQLVAWWSR